MPVAVVRTSLGQSSRMDRQVLTAMITSDRFLREVRPMYSPEFLAAEFARTVAGWCVEHFAAYSQAPQRHIQDRYDRAVREGELPAEQLGLIEKFLSGLSSEFDQAPNASSSGGGGLNIDCLLDETERWWQRRDYEHLSADIREAVERAGPEEAERLLREHLPVRRPTAQGWNPLVDMERVEGHFSETPEPLYRTGGALGELVDRYLVRESFLSLMGPEKRGKTFWLTKLGVYLPLINRCNVAWFQVGDLSEGQTVSRLYTLLTRMPAPEDAGPGVVWAGDCQHNQWQDGARPECPRQAPLCETGQCPHLEDVWEGYRPCTRCLDEGWGDWLPTSVGQSRVLKPMRTADRARAARQLRSRTGGREFRLSCHANRTLTVARLMEILDGWREREGFVPDVVTVDYADILAPEHPHMDPREREDVRWSLLRQVSQRYHCLLWTATQSNRDSQDRDTVQSKHASEDIRKTAHAVGVLGLHRTELEKRAGRCRVSWVLHRQTHFSVHQQVECVQDLARGDACSCSWWRREPQTGAE